MSMNNGTNENLIASAINNLAEAIREHTRAVTDKGEAAVTDNEEAEAALRRKARIDGIARCLLNYLKESNGQAQTSAVIDALREAGYSRSTWFNLHAEIEEALAEMGYAVKRFNDPFARASFWQLEQVTPK
jgi:hypothetical protein